MAEGVQRGQYGHRDCGRRPKAGVGAHPGLDVEFKAGWTGIGEHQDRMADELERGSEVGYIQRHPARPQGGLDFDNPARVRIQRDLDPSIDCTDQCVRTVQDGMLSSDHETAGGAGCDQSLCSLRTLW